MKIERLSNFLCHVIYLLLSHMKFFEMLHANLMNSNHFQNLMRPYVYTLASQEVAKVMAGSQISNQ